MLSKKLLDQYERDGFLSRLRIVDSELAARYQKLFDGIEDTQGRESLRLPEESSIPQALTEARTGGDGVSLFDPHFDAPFIWEIATNHLLLEMVRSLLGPRVMLLCSGISCKYGPSVSLVDQHYDASYLGVTPPEFVSVWYALDRSDRWTGCLEVSAGSHQTGITPLRSSEEDTWQRLELEPGEVSLHHPLLLHRSGPNHTGRRRCGLVFRYASATVGFSRSSTGREFRPMLLDRDPPLRVSG